MKVLLTLLLLFGAPSKGDVYQLRVAKLIDCEIHGRLAQCVKEVRQEGMSKRDLRLALQDVRNALKP